MRTVFALALVTFALPCLAAEPDEATLRTFGARCKAETQSAIEFLTKDLKEQPRRLAVMKRGRVTGAPSDYVEVSSDGYKFSSAATKTKAIKDLTAEIATKKATLAAYKAGDDFYVSYIDQTLTVGSMGRTYAESPATCLQVISPTEYLAEWKVGKGQTVLVRGVDTSRLSNDTTVTLPDVMIVTGTHSYESVIGAKQTVLVIEPLDLDLVKPYLR